MPLHEEVARGDGVDRVIAPTLVIAPTDDMTVMREEIFGPVLPVVSYRTIDEAIAFVNACPRPLALYYFDNDADRIDRLLANTISGGVAINECVFQQAQHNLPFGGIGPSGVGHYHGFDGFATFSKKGGVMVQPRWTTTALLRRPYGARARTVIAALLKIARR